MAAAADEEGFYSWQGAIDKCNQKGTGWYLPDRGVLNMMYNNLHLNGLGGFSDNDYWSSTEVFNYLAWLQSFFIGFQFFDFKDNVYSVRCVRGF